MFMHTRLTESCREEVEEAGIASLCKNIAQTLFMYAHAQSSR